jgi:hypothetical protein
MSDPERLEQNKRVVREFFTRLERDDREGAFGLFVEDAVWFSPTVRQDRPVKEMAGKIGWLLDSMPGGIRFELEHFTAEDDRVAVVAESHGTLVNGREYNNVYHFLFAVRGGRIQRAWEFNDTRHVAEVVGGLPGFAEIAAARG